MAAEKDITHVGIAPPPPFKKLSKRHKTWIEHYVKTGDACEASRVAGFKHRNENTLRAASSRMKRKLGYYIDQKLMESVQSSEAVILAMCQLRTLMTDARSEQVRLAAAKEIMSRAGWDAPKEVTVNHNHNTKSMTDAEIDARIRALQGELAIDVTPVDEQETTATH